MADHEKIESSTHHEETVSNPDIIKPTEAGDEAAKVLNSYDGPTSWEVAEERKLRRKIDWRLMPVLCFTYALQYYDKYNSGWLITTVTAAAASVLILVYRALCIWDNRRRDASGTMERFDHAYEDPTDKENRQFRYIM
ncbi:hypothetical protein BDY17DRAFT_325084 [Neohortaea acidophila]|uniref:Uncharacterized protein n=1 Tax=Neohortaea acidophila TaxID=245834 RepID=A0A6A6PS70_9PEZI|nr:uncharacterized protein BDY17DRAFT_325084 [Neohortaea acidophila]KAF2482832.1 hypothetical protein BDY17DRAFT_325084 [Neohortaea acidophila]